MVLSLLNLLQVVNACQVLYLITLTPRLSYYFVYFVLLLVLQLNNMALINTQILFTLT